MQEYRKLQERTNEDLVKEYQTTHNEDLFRALLEKNTGLLHIIVMDYRIPKYEIEDLLSESYIALIKAVDNFDPTRGVTFTTALKVFVRQHLNRLYNEVTCQKRYNGMDPASYEELVEIHKDDVRGLDCDRFSQIEVDEYLEGLEAKDRYMVTLLLMGYSLSDCAKAFHVANSSITWRIKRIRKNYTAYPDYTEISCNDEARMLGAGFSKPVGGRDHSKHIEELKRKYGGDEDPEYSDLDRKLIAKFRQ